MVYQIILFRIEYNLIEKIKTTIQYCAKIMEKEFVISPTFYLLYFADIQCIC